MSSSKTANLQLNQWQAGDAFLRTEFNEDNAKIDAAIQRVAENPVVGVYTGDGRVNREISLGFRPRFVQMLCTYNTSCTAIFMHNGATARFSNGSAANITSKIYMAEGGFCVAEPGEANLSGQTCYYIAFR